MRAALVETIPVRLDDNLSVAATAGGVMWLASLASLAQLPDRRWPSHPDGCRPRSRSNALVAWAGHRARTVSWPGAVTGALIGITVFAGLGWQGWMLLLVTFIAASVASRMGLKRKMVLGIAEERGGRRGPGNAIANTGVAAIAAAVALAGPSDDAGAARVRRGARGRRQRYNRERNRQGVGTADVVDHLADARAAGTSGAMSLEGTAAGIAGALGSAMAAVALGLAPARAGSAPS